MRRARPPGQDNTRLAAQPMAANGPALDGRGGGKPPRELRHPRRSFGDLCRNYGGTKTRPCSNNHFDIMVQKCYSCGSAKTDNVKLHGFPKDINLREKWVAQIKKNVPIIINQYTRLYSKHFTNDDYYQSSFGNDILKADAVPSRFFCSRKSLLPEFEIRASMSTNKPILTVNDNLENLMLEEEIVVNEDENNSIVSMNNDTYYDTEVTTLQENENIDITKVHLSEKKRKLLR